jgi:glycosyltransferase involved in cell wall biosynthesis
MAEDFVAAGIDRPWCVLPNPIDPDWLRSQAGPPRELPGSPRLLAVGRLFPQKGFDLLLRALPRVLEERPEARLTIVGEGPQRKELESLRDELSIADYVHFAGFQDDPFAWMVGCDLLVSASRYEGFANTTLEAMALGIPVVGTDGPGANDEMIVDGVNGRLVRPLDVVGLASAIVDVTGDLGAFDRAAIAADIAARFGVQSVADRYAAMLELIVDGQPVPQGARFSKPTSDDGYGLHRPPA